MNSFDEVWAKIGQLSSTSLSEEDMAKIIEEFDEVKAEWRVENITNLTEEVVDLIIASMSLLWKCGEKQMLVNLFEKKLNKWESYKAKEVI